MSKKLEVRVSRIEGKKSQVALGNIKEAIKSAQIVLAVDCVYSEEGMTPTYLIYDAFMAKLEKLKMKADKYFMKHPEATREMLEDYLKGK